MPLSVSESGGAYSYPTGSVLIPGRGRLSNSISGIKLHWSATRYSKNAHKFFTAFATTNHHASMTACDDDDDEPPPMNRAADLIGILQRSQSGKNNKVNPCQGSFIPPPQLLTGLPGDKKPLFQCQQGLWPTPNNFTTTRTSSSSSTNTHFRMAADGIIELLDKFKQLRDNYWGC